MAFRGVEADLQIALIDEAAQVLQPDRKRRRGDEIDARGSLGCAGWGEKGATLTSDS